jgi:hypothetical protein
MRNILTAILFAVTSVVNATPSGDATTTPILSIYGDYGSIFDSHKDAQLDLYGAAFAGSDNKFVGVGFFNYGVFKDYGIDTVIAQGDLKDLFFTFEYGDVEIDRSSTIRPYTAYNGSLTVWEMKEGTKFKATGNYSDDYAYISDNAIDSFTEYDISANGEYVIHEWLTSYSSGYSSFDQDIHLDFQMELGQGADGYNYHGYSAPPSSVPVPGAAWLFGTGIIGLAARRKG